MILLRGEIADAVKFVRCTSEIANAVKFAAGELGDASYYRIAKRGFVVMIGTLSRDLLKQKRL